MNPLLVTLLLVGAALVAAPVAAADDCIAYVHGICINDPLCPGPACQGRAAAPRDIDAAVLA